MTWSRVLVLGLAFAFAPALADASGEAASFAPVDEMDGLDLPLPFAGLRGRLSLSGGDQGTRDAAEALGRLDPDRPRREYGAELAAAWDAAPWLTLDANVRLRKTRYIDRGPEGPRVPGMPGLALRLGASVKQLAGGFFGEAHARVLGARPLVEDDSARAASTVLLSARAGYRFAESWTVSADVLFSTNANDGDVALARLDGQALQKKSLLFRLNGEF